MLIAQFRIFPGKAKTMTFELWSNTQLADAIDSLMERSERDEALLAELAVQLENIRRAELSSVPRIITATRTGYIKAGT
jgi:hypothetical protein